ncbi:hypothetical protein [Mycoplana ramosa]|uniref:Uncharacterized protein n=2 Tax=Mycoplana ramosa TaxID=40837 RepID=A0ABW3YX83_MYCRA
MVEPLEALLGGEHCDPVSEVGERLDSRDVASQVVARFPELAIHQDNEPGSTRGQLVRLLNECVMAGHFPKAQKGRIDREHLAERLQTSVGSIRKYKSILASYDSILPHFAPADDIADEVKRRFPNLALHQFYPADSTKGKLVKMLNECVLAGRIPRSTNVIMISLTCH